MDTLYFLIYEPSQPWIFMEFSNNFLIIVLAIVLDAILGDPKWVYSKIPHPVAVIGFQIERLDRFLNQTIYSTSTRKIFGVFSAVIVISSSWLFGWLIDNLCSQVSFGIILQVVTVSIFLAQNSLYRHVASVAKACSVNDIISARSQISHIVGRDPNSLDQKAIGRAAIESLSENFSDGVVAPIFWYAVGGLPALIAYKALNTSDSMIGYLNEKYAHFGWCSARLDDLANFIPARLSALIISVAAFLIPSANGSNALKTVIRDAKKHRSKNAGWPEAAMAGALDIKIAGPRHYSGGLVNDAWMGAGTSNVEASHIHRALRIFCVSCVLNVFWLILLDSINF